MYAFRRPITVGLFEDAAFRIPGLAVTLDGKTAFLLAQVVGYIISKYAGVRICSEIRGRHLVAALLLFVIISWLALLGFAVLPAPLKPLAVFCNGLPLGMIWGLVVRFLEGRRLSELLLAALSCSYILASGEVKRTGAWLLQTGLVNEYWMPFATGSLYLLPFILSVGLLSLLPAPTAEDEALKTPRREMMKEERSIFLRRFLPGLVLLFLTYLLLTGYRDYRDFFQAELFREMGILDAGAFARTERPIAFGVILLLGLIFLIKSPRRGLAAVFALMATGLVLLAGSTLSFQRGWISGEAWMSLSGLGAYLAYVPFGSVLFDRIIAATRHAGTAVFAIYVADALGYTGSVGLMLYRDLADDGAGRLGFFTWFSHATAIAGIPFLILAGVYFIRQSRRPAGE